MFLIFLLSVNLRAQIKTIEIFDEDSRLDIIKQIEVFYQQDTISSFKDIQKEVGFSSTNGNVFIEYLNNEILWVRFCIKNSCEKDRKFLIEIPNATINDLTFYKETSTDNYDIIKTGASFNYNTRDVKTRFFTFEVDIPPGEKKNFYININPEKDAMNLPLVVWKIGPYINNAVSERYFLGVYYGSILFIIIFHLFLFYKFRDKALVFYMLYVAGFAGYQLYMDGFASKHIFSSYPDIAKSSLSMFAYLCFWSMIIFTQLYLNTALITPFFNRILNVFKWVLLIGLFLCLISYQMSITMNYILNFLGPLSTLMVIIAAFICSRHEPYLSKYLIVAFLFLIGGILLEVTKNTGIAYNSNYALKLGHASEAIILAFALAVRFKMNNDKTRNLALERLENLNQLKDQYNAELERTVFQRTEELNISNKNLNDSILYARHIQYSLLPSKHLLEHHFLQHFIFFKPKDIISGDFYWFEKIDDILIMAVVDCTGHGVPGAFMSMLGSTILRQIVKINKITEPEKILKLLDNEISCTLKQNHEDPFNKDGMDLSLVSYDLKNASLRFSGAKRPLIHINDEGKMIFYKGSKYSIGGDMLDSHNKVFYSENIPVKKGDSIYLFTDGIIDQFGGASDKKFMMNKFKDLLQSIQNLQMVQQGQMIESKIDEWRWNTEQVDDMLVVGLKF